MQVLTGCVGRVGGGGARVVVGGGGARVVVGGGGARVVVGGGGARVVLGGGGVGGDGGDGESRNESHLEGQTPSKASLRVFTQ